MNNLHYCNLKEVNENDLLTLLNNKKTREHLLKHDTFDKIKLRSWVEEKEQLNNIKGCRIKAIEQDGMLIGW